MNKIKLHMTIVKLSISDSAYLVLFSQVLWKLFTLLIITTDGEIYNIYQYIFYCRGHTHTDTH